MTEEEFNALGEPDIADTNDTEEIPETAPVEDAAEGETEQPTDTSDSEETTPEDTTEVVEDKPEQPEEKPVISNELLQQKLAEIKAQRERTENTAYRSAIGQVNPFNDKVIQSLEDFDEYKKEYEFRSFMGRFKEGQATKSEFDEFIRNVVQNTPEVAEARKAKEQLERAAQQERTREGRERLEGDIAKLNKQYPNSNIKTITDIEKDNTVKGYLLKGLTVIEAYKLAHMDEITRSTVETKTAATKQAAINQVNSKQHLKATTGGNAVDDVTSIPEDVRKVYKQMFPKWNDKQIFDDYKKHK